MKGKGIFTRVAYMKELAIRVVLDLGDGACGGEGGGVRGEGELELRHRWLET